MLMVCGRPQKRRKGQAHVDRGSKTLISLWTS